VALGFEYFYKRAERVDVSPEYLQKSSLSIYIYHICISVYICTHICICKYTYEYTCIYTYVHIQIDT